MPTTLMVDHDLYFVAVEFLRERDNGERRFEYANAHHDFFRSPAVQRAFKLATGEDLAGDRILEADMFAGATYVHDHNVNLDYYREQIVEQPEAVSEFIATAGFTFLTAWTQRYGALEGDRYSHRLVAPYGYEEATA